MKTRCTGRSRSIIAGSRVPGDQFLTVFVEALFGVVRSGNAQYETSETGDN